MHEKIAKIESTFLGIEDHGILTAWLTFDYGNSSVQSAGMYAYDQHIEGKKRRQGHPSLAVFVRGVLEICGVDQWEKLKGRTIFALFEKDEWNSKVIGIKSLPTEGSKQFLFSEQFD